MRIHPALVGAALAALALPGHAAAAECFDSGTNYSCTVEREADGSFTASSPEFGEVMFLVDGSGEAERLNYSAAEDRSFRAGYYRAVTDTPGCWQNTQFESDIFCAWD